MLVNKAHVNRLQKPQDNAPPKPTYPVKDENPTQRRERLARQAQLRQNDQKRRNQKYLDRFTKSQSQLLGCKRERSTDTTAENISEDEEIPEEDRLKTPYMDPARMMNLQDIIEIMSNFDNPEQFLAGGDSNQPEQPYSSDQGFTNVQKEHIMLDYVNNIRLEHMLNILKMPPSKCKFPPRFCHRGTNSGIFWLITRFLTREEMASKVKMLSHLHRQLYFKFLLVENEQNGIDANLLQSKQEKKEQWGQREFSSHHSSQVTHRIISFKPNNYIEYLLLSAHIQLQRDFYVGIQSTNNNVRKEYPANVMFTEFILKDTLKFPFNSILANYDLVFFREMLLMNNVRILKLGTINLDSRFSRSMESMAEMFANLRLLHLGVIGRTFKLSQFLGRCVKSEFLEELGWVVGQNKCSRVDLLEVLQNCPKLSQLYLNVEQLQQKNINLNQIVMTSCRMNERINFLRVKQSKCKVMFDPMTTLNSNLKFFRIDSDHPFPWYEKEKFPRPIISIDFRNLHIPPMNVESFEWQAKMSKFLQEIRLKTDVPFLRLHEIQQLKLIDIDLSQPINVVSIMNCPSLLQISTKNLMIIDSSSVRVINLKYEIDKSKVQASALGDDHHEKIEYNFLKSFGLLAESELNQGNVNPSNGRSLEKVEISTMVDHHLRSLDHLKEMKVGNMGGTFVFNTPFKMSKLELRSIKDPFRTDMRQDSDRSANSLTPVQLMLPSFQILNMKEMVLHVGVNMQNFDLILLLFPNLVKLELLLRLKRPKGMAEPRSTNSIKAEDIPMDDDEKQPDYINANSFSELKILHPKLKKLTLISDKNEDLGDAIMERLVVLPLTTSLQSLSLFNFKYLKFVDIFAPEIQKIKLQKCLNVRKVEVTESVDIRKFSILGLTLDQNHLLQNQRDQIIEEYLACGESVTPLYIFHHFQPNLQQIEMRAWLEEDNEFSFLWDRNFRYFLPKTNEPGGGIKVEGGIKSPMIKSSIKAELGDSPFERMGGCKAIMQFMFKDYKSVISADTVISRFFPMIEDYLANPQL